MIHVEKIKVVGDTHPVGLFPTGFEIVCSDVNLLVGNQGCGKSTLLNYMHNHKETSPLQITLSENVVKNGVDIFKFDSEKDNPRMTDPALYTTPSGTNKGIGYGGALQTRFMSHG